jgi:hypothetical protein
MFNMVDCKFMIQQVWDLFKCYLKQCIRICGKLAIGRGCKQRSISYDYQNQVNSSLLILGMPCLPISSSIFWNVRKCHIHHLAEFVGGRSKVTMLHSKNGGSIQDYLYHCWWWAISCLFWCCSCCEQFSPITIIAISWFNNNLIHEFIRVLWWFGWCHWMWYCWKLFPI